MPARTDPPSLHGAPNNLQFPASGRRTRDYICGDETAWSSSTKTALYSSSESLRVMDNADPRSDLVIFVERSAKASMATKLGGSDHSRNGTADINLLCSNPESGNLGTIPVLVSALSSALTHLFPAMARSGNADHSHLIYVALDWDAVTSDLMESLSPMTSRLSASDDPCKKRISSYGQVAGGERCFVRDISRGSMRTLPRTHAIFSTSQV